MKIKYVKAYCGIQPGTVVDEHREDVVARMTKQDSYTDDKGQLIKFPPYAVMTNDQTTQERELAAAKAAKAGTSRKESVTA